ncbi:MlaA family lipoprotein [Alteraurantiacibacter palmitatis]|uniref:VacJ family lipoprotein n=1 Tax=Alteraurantiacibacter palmitatis TaxID=2054628 RepID=A0ABV7E4I6_9SPHN
MSLSLVPALLATAAPLSLADTPVSHATLPVSVAASAEGAAALAEAQQEGAPAPAEGIGAGVEQPAATVTDLDAAEPQDVIIVEGNLAAPPGDPLESVNIQVYEVTQSIDRNFVAPVAEVYRDDLPKPLRNGLRNLLRNLLEPVNFVNFLLQLKPGKAVETLARFTINSTVGIGGLFDIAAGPEFQLPYRRNGLANTLGYYGVGPGPFLVLPLIGATTLRDIIGSTLDQAVVPLAVGAPFNTPYYAVPAYTVNSLQFRIEFDERLGQIRDSVDPYSAMRESYLCLREADIAALRNRPAPRDCSIDALMADPVPVAPAAAAVSPADTAPAIVEAPAPSADQAELAMEAKAVAE